MGKESTAVILNPSKVMNSVCGLERNAVRYGIPLDGTSCQNGVCSVVIAGIVPNQQYMFNVVADSMRSYNASYGGVIVTGEWHETATAVPDRVLKLLSAVCGTVMGVVFIGYLWIVKLYA